MTGAIGTRAARLLILAAARLGVGVGKLSIAGRDGKRARATARVLPAIAVLGLAILPGTAVGDPGYTLTVSGPATVTPGQTPIFHAAGANPPTDFFSSWLDVSAIPTSVLATCPDDYLTASQIAESAHAQGGERVVVGQRETVDANGNFSIPFGYSPRIAGSYLLCAYSNDGATYTLAKSSLNVRVDAGGPPQPPSQPQTSTPTQSTTVTKPVNVSAPRVVRSARKLVCRRGTWSHSPRTFAYRWLIGGKQKRGATTSRLAITRSVRGRMVRCAVTASNAGGRTVAVSTAVRAR